MLREVINRRQVRLEPLNDQDSYFVMQPTTTGFNREVSISRRDISLRNFACLDSETNKMYLNFDALEDYREDRLNFIAVIGYEHSNQKEGLIDISEEPLSIINGIQYFLLMTESCSVDILKILYTLSQSIYVNQKYLAEFEATITSIVDTTQTWDIKNYLYVVSKHFQGSSQIRTATETRDFHDFHQSDKNFSKIGRNISISGALQNYFSEIMVIARGILFQYDLFTIKDNTQSRFNIQCSRWHTYEAILKGCTKILTGSKTLALRQFYKINAATILDEFEQRALSNYHIFTFEAIRSYNNRKKDIIQRSYQELVKENQRQRQKDIQRQRQKERQKEKQRLKRLKKNILLPFFETENTWIGKIDAFKQKYMELRQKIEQEYEKVLVTMNENDEAIMNSEIDKLAANQNCIQAIGNSKFDGLNIKFGIFVKKMKGYLVESIKSNFVNKKWIIKDNSSGKKDDMLSNLDSRIQINERKKDALEQGIKLALKEYQYLQAVVLRDKKNKLSFQIQK